MLYRRFSFVVIFIALVGVILSAAIESTQRREVSGPLDRGGLWTNERAAVFANRV